MSAEVVQRLEAVAARLESVAASLGKGGSGSSTGAAAGGAGGASSSQLRAYDDYYSSSVQPFVDAANKLPGTKQFVSTYPY